MTHSTSLPQLASQAGLKHFFRPAFPWAAILGFSLITAISILGGIGGILNLIFPAGALAVALYLYVGFSFWICFLTPLVRRLADYRGGGVTNPSPILLAPSFVLAVAAITLWKNLPAMVRNAGTPYILTTVGVGYGCIIGLSGGEPAVVVLKTTLEWITPILFSIHCFLNWQAYPHWTRLVSRVMVWGVLIMGVYGVFQYLVAPEWDRLWLINSGMVSIGRPEPLGIRVWSTMNSPRTFGTVMMAGLLIVFSSPTPLKLPANIGGYISFLLSLSRTAWVSLVIGLAMLMSSVKSNIQIRLILTVVLLAVSVVPFTMVEPFATVIRSRIESFSTLEEDGSADARADTYEQNLDEALGSFMGHGLGSFDSDSGILNLLFNLGWFGIAFYIGGILLITFKLFNTSVSRHDTFFSTGRAIVAATLAQLPLGGPLGGAQGMILWSFMGLCMAGLHYHRYRQDYDRRSFGLTPNIEPINGSPT
jgi:hypothetical protein